MSSSEREQLASCPFCGEAGELNGVGDWFGVGCQASQKCPAYRRALTHRTEADAIAAWNRRAQAGAEPFGYFRADPFGWTDCAETDEGAKALYEAAPQQAPDHAALLAEVDYSPADDESGALAPREGGSVSAPARETAPRGLVSGEIQMMPAALRQREAANSPLIMVNAARFVTVELAGTITGLGASAVRKRLERGVWLEGKHWRRAADGRIYIDMKGVEKWVEGTE